MTLQEQTCIHDDRCAPSTTSDDGGAVPSRDTAVVKEEDAVVAVVDDANKDEDEDGEGEEDDGGQDDKRCRVRLVRSSPSNSFRLAPASRLENNLPFAVGLLELANAGDFAANVWNQIPVPVYAMVLMALGGSLALIMSLVALFDVRRAWSNVQFLRRQRRRLRLRQQSRRRQQQQQQQQQQQRLDAALRAVSFRELWSEIINRLAMDILMGAGALLIAAGTFMAMGGDDERVWNASNILSGYLGNTPLALFALVNSSWALFLAATAQSHVRATRRRGMAPAAELVKRRSRNVQVFCVINGTAAVVGGVGSMLTATKWWAYVLLAPVVVSSVFCNLWWRRRVGYTRARGRVSAETLESDLEYAAWAEVTLREKPSPSTLTTKTYLSRLIASPTSLSDVLGWLQRHDLFPDMCVFALADASIREALVLSTPDELDVGIAELLALPPALHPRLLIAADACVARIGRKHFRHRERYLAELLGTYCTVKTRAEDEEVGEK